MLEEYIKGVITEYMQNDMVYLKQYLTMSDEQKAEDLFYKFPDSFMDYLKSEQEDLYGKLDGDIEELYALTSSDFSKDVINGFYEYFMDHPDMASDEELPSWYFMEFEKIVKNQWLIHFTDVAYGIARDGFTIGISELDKLGLTTYWSNDSYAKREGGYNFAYLLTDVGYGGSRGRYKYGQEAVIFKASGIRVYHSGDREYQTIFLGNTAKNIIPIKQDDGGAWSIEGGKWSERVAQFETPGQAADWVENNWEQYRKHIAPRKTKSS